MKLPAFLLYVRDGRKIRRGPFQKDVSDPACTVDTLSMGAELIARYGIPGPQDKLVLLEVHGTPQDISIEAISFTNHEIGKMVKLARQYLEQRRANRGKARAGMVPALSH
jgi:hypothetical protein